MEVRLTQGKVAHIDREDWPLVAPYRWYAALVTPIAVVLKQYLTMHYLLFYDANPDYADRRMPLRAAHLAHARAAVTRDELVLGGAMADPIDGAVLLFRGKSPAAAEAFARTDPYVMNGLVAAWLVRVWTTVVGELAEVKLT